VLFDKSLAVVFTEIDCLFITGIQFLNYYKDMVHLPQAQVTLAELGYSVHAFWFFLFQNIF
jgi:hypothetical protein